MRMLAIIGTAAGARAPCGMMRCVVPPLHTCFEHDVPGSAVAWYVGFKIVPVPHTAHSLRRTASATHTPPGPLACMLHARDQPLKLRGAGARL